MAFVCDTCEDYEFVENEQTGKLEPCPDCKAGEFAECPVHGERVLLRRNGRLAGVCWSCKREEAAGIRWLRENRWAA